MPVSGTDEDAVVGSTVGDGFLKDSLTPKTDDANTKKRGSAKGKKKSSVKKGTKRKKGAKKILKKKNYKQQCWELSGDAMSSAKEVTCVLFMIECFQSGTETYGMHLSIR